MSSHIKNIQDLNLDIISIIINTRREQQQQQYYKNIYNNIMNELTNEGEHLIVRYFLDGCNLPNRCPYMIWEYGCVEEDEDED